MELKVVSFNIRSCDDPSGNSIAERAPRLHKIISDIDPDLIGIQEFVPKWEAHFEKYFQDKYEMVNIYRTSTGWLESGPLLYRRGSFKLIDTGKFWYSDTPEVESGGWDVTGHNRMCVYIVLEENASGKRFVFMNTHFGFGADCQINSARLIKEYAAGYENMPLFITGDFNAPSDTPVYAEMTSFLTDANPDKVSPTFHAYSPGLRDQHIDYCFHNGNCKAESVRIIRDTVDEMYPSDHYGLEIVINI